MEYYLSLSFIDLHFSFLSFKGQVSLGTQVHRFGEWRGRWNRKRGGGGEKQLLVQL